MIIIMKKVTAAADMKKDIHAETAAGLISRHLPDAMLIKHAVFTTKVHLTTVRSLILLMTVENLWNSSAEPVR